MAKIVSIDHVASLVEDGAVVIPGGFGCCGHPEAVTRAIARRFRKTGHPRNLTLLFAAGPGDRDRRGLNRLALPGLIKCVIGGFWGFVPRLGRLAAEGAIEAHNWPQGVISKLFRAIASGQSGLLSTVGLGTFVDPRGDGGRLNEGTTPLVRLVNVMDEQTLYYPAPKIDIAYIRGTSADAEGNLTMEEEATLGDALVQAQAAHNANGIVVAQVRRIVPQGTLHPQMVRVPGALVDYIVVCEDEEDHRQTYDEVFNPDFSQPGTPDFGDANELPGAGRDFIVRRAMSELEGLDRPIVNLGIGIPAEIGNRLGRSADFNGTLTVEGGAFGGNPAYGLSFGASAFPDAVIDQNNIFDLYDGGGIDIGFLGFAEVDGSGNVNVGSYNDRITGVGGFINISQNAKRVVFCGTLTAGGIQVGYDEDSRRLEIRQEGHIHKFVNAVEQICYSGSRGEVAGRPPRFITERAVFDLVEGELVVSEIAPGISLDRDIRSVVGFPVRESDAGVRSIPDHVYH